MTEKEETPSEYQISARQADIRKALYPRELSEEIKAEFEQGYQGGDERS